MTFNPALPTLRDRIRMIVGDITGVEATETFLDESYDAVIAEHTNWKVAAAVMAEGVAVTIERDPSSFTATGDMAVSWNDRTRSLRDIAKRLRAEAATEELAGNNLMVSERLVRDGGSSVAEYVPSRYARLRR